jgi:hypothetical protein
MVLVWYYSQFHSRSKIITLHVYPCVTLTINTHSYRHSRCTQFTKFIHIPLENTDLSVEVLTFLQVHFPSIPEAFDHHKQCLNLIRGVVMFCLFIADWKWQNKMKYIHQISGYLLTFFYFDAFFTSELICGASIYYWGY